MKFRTDRKKLFCLDSVLQYSFLSFRVTHLVLVPVGTTRKIWIGVNQSDTAEIWSTLDCRQVQGITDKLRVVHGDNRGGDQVGTGGEIDDGGSDGGGFTTQTTAASVLDRSVDSSRIVRYTITWRLK